MTDTVIGPFGWANWHARDEGLPEAGTVEYVFYSDSSFVDEILDDDIPYRVLNLVSDHLGTGIVQPQLAVQVPFHLQLDATSDLDTTTHEPGSFHGGWVDDELAALLCVALDVRLQSGGMWRTFNFNLFNNDDDRGHPRGFDLRPPTFLTANHRGQREIVPNLARAQVDLGPARELLCEYARLNTVQAIAYVRAARQFQRAAWVAESDPDLAWISLVGALEALAVATDFGVEPESMSILESAWPELAALLETIDVEIREPIAALVAPQARAAFKVRKLIETHSPAPPENRSTLQIDWTNIVSLVNKVYSHRSRALHAGIPIPSPMNHPPHPDDAGNPAEGPLGLSTHSYDASWPASETPMLLWTFHFVVRGVLLSWLSSSSSQEQSNPD